MRLKDGVPTRSVTDVGPGDFIKVGSQWKEIQSNSAHGSEHTPKHWDVRTTDGGTHGMFGINRYAKASDLE